MKFNGKFYTLDGRTISLYSGYDNFLFCLIQLIFLFFCLILAVLHLNGLRLGLIVFLCLSISNVVICNLTLASVFDPNNYDKIFGMDRETARLYVRLIAPMMHLFNLLFAICTYSLLWNCGIRVKQSLIAGNFEKLMRILLSGFWGNFFFLLFPLSFFISYGWTLHEFPSNAKENAPDMLYLFALMALVGSWFLLRVPKVLPIVRGDRDVHYQELSYRRLILLRCLLFGLCCCAPFIVPWTACITTFSPYFEVLRLIALLLQMSLIMVYIRYNTFARLPKIAISWLDRDTPTKPLVGDERSDAITRKGLLFAILRKTLGPVPEYERPAESYELNNLPSNPCEKTSLNQSSSRQNSNAHVFIRLSDFTSTRS